MEILTSRNNPGIKAAAALKENQERRKTGLFLLEGARLCADAALNGIEITHFYVTENAADKYEKEFLLLKDTAAYSFYINDSVAEKLSDTKNSQQFFAVCRQSMTETELSEDGMYVFADNVQNPDNLGAIVRTAEALGASGLIINSGCDIYSPKAQRAAMGALLRFPVIRTDDGESFLRTLKNKNMKIYSSVADSTARKVTDVKEKGGTVLVIGNEGNGVSEKVLALSDYTVTIPMAGKAESLNASAAAAILIWEFMKDRI